MGRIECPAPVASGLGGQVQEFPTLSPAGVPVTDGKVGVLRFVERGVEELLAASRRYQRLKERDAE